MSELFDALDTRLRSFLSTHTGEPQHIGGHTFIPITAVSGGFGAGEKAAADSSEAESGVEAAAEPLQSGIGSGGVAIPLGAYRVNDDDELVFEPNPITFLALAIPFVAVLGFTLRGIIKVAKR